MISNSLDIDLIHGDIHGRSCKKVELYYNMLNFLETIVDYMDPTVRCP